jgi:hypothetical protein
MATTPLEREILTHYATTGGPYRGGADNWTSTHHEIVQRFVTLGLLIRHPGEDGLQRIRANDEALRVYLAALAAVPLPVQRWVVPAAPSPGAEQARDRHDGRADAQASAETTAGRLAALEREVRDLRPDDALPSRRRFEVEED